MVKAMMSHSSRLPGEHARSPLVTPQRTVDLEMQSQPAGESRATRVQAFARDHFHRPWASPALAQNAPSGQWPLRVGWGCRGGLVIFVCMWYATLPDLNKQSWQAFAVLCPAIAGGVLGMVPVRVCGALIVLSRHFLSGAVIAACVSIVVIEASRPLAAPNAFDQGRDMLCFVLTALGFLFVCSRPSLNIVQKKIACALIAISTHLTARAGFPDSTMWGASFPFKIIVPLALALTACVCSTLLPLPAPVTAVGALRQRARFHVQLVHALLQTTLYLSLTYDAAALAHAEGLIAQVEENEAAMGPLLTLAKAEITLALPCGPLVSAQRLAIGRLETVVAYLRGTVEPLQGCIRTMRGRPLNGTISSTQTKYLSVVMEVLHEAVAAFAAVLEGAVEATLQAAMGPPGRRQALASQAVVRRLASARERLEAATAAFGELDRQARSNIFYRGGQLFDAPEGEAEVARRADEHMRRMTLTASLGRLFHLTSPDLGQLESAAHMPSSRGPAALLKASASWLHKLFTQCPDRTLAKAVTKNTLALSLCASMTFVHRFRFKDIAPDVREFWEVWLRARRRRPPPP